MNSTHKEMLQICADNPDNYCSCIRVKQPNTFLIAVRFVSPIKLMDDSFLALCLTKDRVQRFKYDSILSLNIVFADELVIPAPFVYVSATTNSMLHQDLVTKYHFVKVDRRALPEEAKIPASPEIFVAVGDNTSHAIHTHGDRSFLVSFFKPEEGETVFTTSQSFTDPDKLIAYLDNRYNADDFVKTKVRTAFYVFFKGEVPLG